MWSIAMHCDDQWTGKLKFNSVFHKYNIGNNAELANAKLAQKGEHSVTDLTPGRELTPLIWGIMDLSPVLDLESEALGSVLTGVYILFMDSILTWIYILFMDFLFSRSKASDANISIIANFVYLIT